MDFIRVTLYEKLATAGQMSNRKTHPDYLLAVNGIKSIAIKLNSTTGNTYYVDIAKGFEPEGVLFEVESIEAELPTSFIRIVN